MANPTVNLEREQLLKLIEEYRGKGYDVLLHPGPDELPDFLRNYRPDLIVRRGQETVVIEVKSRLSLNSSSTQSLRDLAQVIESHPGWRFELVMINPDDAVYAAKAERSLQESEIQSQLQVARQLTIQHPESAILYAWSLVEATLRLLANAEGLSLRRFDPLYLLKQLATEGLISKSDYQLLMNALSLRNAIAHGFKTKELTQNSVYELIEVTEQLLRSLQTNNEAD